MTRILVILFLFISGCANIKIKPVAASLELEKDKFSLQSKLTIQPKNVFIPELEVTTVTNQDFLITPAHYNFTWTIDNIW